MKIEPILYETYLQMIKSAPGSGMFRSSFAKVDGKKKDILENGNLSCAFFVSSLLVVFGLIDRIHATVRSTVSDMENSGWEKIRTPKPGAVIVWEPKIQGGSTPHAHIGFCVSKEKAVSNDWKKGSPALHPITFGTRKGAPVRAIESIWWNRTLA